MVDAEVSERMRGDDVAKTLETTEAELMHAVFPHFTPAEMMHEAVLDADHRAAHFQAGERRATTGGSAPAAFGKL